ncbi:asparagine synthase (glutamine-hydrolyzing) [Fictibacillus enclensis]|uniref:asparagine synthase (glutamine-hydrolyzing) n=1 Tax=Fictibacillus enclensis TaxID=1017270 RepID=UPI0024BF41D6|nr:asparagine synthase (glutamine-hydrolyzing) [Fictibacillus enclensis]WHY72179.1 asparagine synthase (glutamine-hydrolyzing) [Fictibacillus enclensis]
MCGIAGWINWSEDISRQQSILRDMTGAIEHRGPDADGFWFSPRAVFGHRRLIVIDPKGGLQPMLHEQGDQTLALTYNGEIYNFLELKKELEGRGHSFRTQSDTEVLLHSYMEWGEECVDHLNGIFAFAIWDEKRQKLFLGRDHLGVKPLFYAQRGNSIIFGSELKVLLAHPDIQPEVDKQGLAEVFALGPMRTPGVGVFKDVKEVRAGHSITFTSNQTKVRQYWKLESKEHTDTVEETAEKIQALLKDTVNRQLIADLPLVSMLSGGLDSSGLTALAGKDYKEAGKILHTYSIDFANSAEHFQTDLLHLGLDEPWVKRVSEHVGTEHHSTVLGANDLLDNFLKPMYARDLPGLGEMETSLYLLFREMKKDATVALSGESADEVFSGYPWFHQDEFLNGTTFPWRQSRGYFSNILSEEATRSIQPEAYANRRYQEALAEVPALKGESEIGAKQRRMSYQFITRFLPFMLDRKDRMSMAVGFEVRVPFCDYRLVEYLWNVPWEVKSVDNIEKGILRRALKGYLPDDVRNRRKSAYPTAQDPVYFGGIKNWLLDIVNDSNAPVNSLVDASKIKAIAEGKTGISEGQATKLMEYLIHVNTWLKDYHIKLV